MTPLEAWYFEIPIVTRTFLTAIFLTTIACQLDLLHPVQLLFSYDLVFKAGQYWRLVTTFLYFGSFNLDFLFHMVFTIRYSRMLEENSFRGRTADYLYMLLISATAIVILTPLLTARSTSIPFLSSPLTFALVYLWSRRNSGVRMNFLGVFTFNSPYLPWVLLSFTLLLHGVWPTADLLGMAVGHTYYFLDDVWPRGGVGRPRLLRCPAFIRGFVERMLGEGDVVGGQDDGVPAVPRIADEVRPGGGGGLVEDVVGFAGFREWPQAAAPAVPANAHAPAAAAAAAPFSTSAPQTAEKRESEGTASDDDKRGVKLMSSADGSTESAPSAEEVRRRRLAALGGGGGGGSSTSAASNSATPSD